MAMIATPAEDEENSVMGHINTTPLVDVMLVLLIIFLITIPVVTTSIPVQLPRERVEVRESRPENVIISVDRAGNVFWYETRMDSPRELIGRLRKVSHLRPQPEVQIRGDLAARYDGVGKVLYACQVAGIARVSFITQPPPLGG
jgi:biopolymer transport protein ExbD